MNVFKTIAVAFSMFSAIPMPQFPWEKENMRYSLVAFPLIGVVLGLVSWGIWALCELFGLPELLRGAALCLCPVLLTGGIHLDGYADTCDALASHGEPEKLLQILRDPHVGAFAVIRLGLWFILTFALWSCLPLYRPVPVLLGCCLSRTLSGLAVASFPLAKNTGLAHTFAQAADRQRVKKILGALDVALTLSLCAFGREGAAMALAAQLVFLYYYRMSRNRFGGLTGDLAGWFLVQAEKWMLIALAAVEFLEAVL